jgi:hypothetical protein
MRQSGNRISIRNWPGAARTSRTGPIWWSTPRLSIIQEKVHPKVLIDDLLCRGEAPEPADDPQLDLFSFAYDSFDTLLYKETTICKL